MVVSMPCVGVVSNWRGNRTNQACILIPNPILLLTIALVNSFGVEFFSGAEIVRHRKCEIPGLPLLVKFGVRPIIVCLRLFTGHVERVGNVQPQTDLLFYNTSRKPKLCE